MAMTNPQMANDKKRVKVYELRNNDWFDRGTGFCAPRVDKDESKIFVESEDQPDRVLLETRITKDDGFQKQQDTLIVWTETNGPDMALSFQEAGGCAAIWEFVSHVQQNLQAIAGPDDALSDETMEGFPNPVMLPPPELGNVLEIEQVIRAANTSQGGRDSLTKFLIAEDYILKLVQLVPLAEQLEDLASLHRLSNTMKMLILLNDTQIIEQMVSDEVVLGVVGALEYDPEFPNHKASHRQYLRNKSRFKEVVPIEDPMVTKKIHATWRLQYLKDVVLARILDDPTFSVLNSLIFFNQVDIVNYVQNSAAFLEELFSLIDGDREDATRVKDAVLFIQQCCAIAKNLQAPARQSLYANFIQNGLLNVIVFALGREEAPVRIAGTDILVAMIDHDPSMVRSHIFKAITEKKTPLTDTLIDLLLVESDLGIKAQAADAIKVLLDPQQGIPTDRIAQINEQFLPKFRPNPQLNQQTDSFIQDFFENGAKRLFQPLKDLEHRETVRDLSFNEVSLFCHLVDVLMYFVRQHLLRSKFFIATEGISARIKQLLACPQKHMKLNDFYYQQLIQNHVFGPILDVVFETMPRDNLLNSACLELFEFTKRENIKPVLIHVVETYRQRLQEITYVDLFEDFVHRYEQMQGYAPEMDTTLFGGDDEGVPPQNRINRGNQQWQGLPDIDPDQEQYFNASDEEDELVPKMTKPKVLPSMNGSLPGAKSLVDYPDDDDEDDEDEEDEDNDVAGHGVRSFYGASVDVAERGANNADLRSDQDAPLIPPSAPLERLSEKRRREDDEDDELGKLALTKRRGSSASTNSVNSTSTSTSTGGIIRRKKSFTAAKDATTGKRIAISLAVKSPIEMEQNARNDGA